MSDVVYPKGEVIWFRYCDSKGHLQYLLTSKTPTHTEFILYRYSKGSFEKLGKGPNPIVLEEKYGVRKQFEN